MIKHPLKKFCCCMLVVKMFIFTFEKEIALFNAYFKVLLILHKKASVVLSI